MIQAPRSPGRDGTSETLENGLKKSNVENAEVAGVWRFQFELLPPKHLFEYRLEQMIHGQELFPTAPDLKLHDTFTRPSVPVLTDLMHSRGAALFDRPLSELGKQYCFVNVPCAFGTIQGVSFLHVAVTSPSCLDNIIAT
jgi:hypothetical protein